MLVICEKKLLKCVLDTELLENPLTLLFFILRRLFCVPEPGLDRKPLRPGLANMSRLINGHKLHTKSAYGSVSKYEVSSRPCVSLLELNKFVVLDAIPTQYNIILTWIVACLDANISYVSRDIS